MTIPPPLRWRHAFDPGPDFIAKANDELIGRVTLSTRAEGERTWRWALHCSQRLVGLPHPTWPMSGVEPDKAAAVERVRAGWQAEWVFRAELRAILAEDPTHASPHVISYLIQHVEDRAVIEVLQRGAEAWIGRLYGERPHLVG